MSSSPSEVRSPPAPPGPQRIAPGGRRDVGLLTWGFAQIAGLASRTEPMKLFLTLGRHRRLFRFWLPFAGQLMPFGALPRRETELVILRVAHLRSCAYEFQHHIHLGRRAGVGKDLLARVVEGPSAAGWSARERAMLTAVDELIATRDLADGTWATLSEHLDTKHLIELLMLVTQYDALATTLLTLRVAPDRRKSG